MQARIWQQELMPSGDCIFEVFGSSGDSAELGYGQHILSGDCGVLALDLLGFEVSLNDLIGFERHETPLPHSLEGGEAIAHALHGPDQAVRVLSCGIGLAAFAFAQDVLAVALQSGCRPLHFENAAPLSKADPAGESVALIFAPAQVRPLAGELYGPAYAHEVPTHPAESVYVGTPRLPWLKHFKFRYPLIGWIGCGGEGGVPVCGLGSAAGICLLKSASSLQGSQACALGLLGSRLGDAVFCLHATPCAAEGVRHQGRGMGVVDAECVWQMRGVDDCRIEHAGDHAGRRLSLFRYRSHRHLVHGIYRACVLGIFRYVDGDIYQDWLRFASCFAAGRAGAVMLPQVRMGYMMVISQLGWRNRAALINVEHFAMRLDALRLLPSFSHSASARLVAFLQTWSCKLIGGSYSAEDAGSHREENAAVGISSRHIGKAASSAGKGWMHADASEPKGSMCLHLLRVRRGYEDYGICWEEWLRWLIRPKRPMLSKGVGKHESGGVRLQYPLSSRWRATRPSARVVLPDAKMEDESGKTTPDPENPIS